MSFRTHCNRAFNRPGFVVPTTLLLFCCWVLTSGQHAPGAQVFSQSYVNQHVTITEIADVLIRFDSQIDWSQYELPHSKDDKAVFVYQKLKEQAAATQVLTRLFLDQNALSYTPYLVTNAIHARLPAEYVKGLRTLPGVASVTNNEIWQEEGITVETDALSFRGAGPEWGILNIRADSVWALGYRGQGVVVAGADTGFDWDHPALKEKYRGTVADSADHAYNWHDAIHEISPLHNDSIVDPSNNPCGLSSPFPCDDGGHGTHTMGTMIGEDGMEQIGVAPEARWIACRNMERGYGSPATYLECMEWFLAPTDGNGANPDPLKAPHVINNSWSCPEFEGCNPDNFELLRQAVVNLKAAGIVVVVSAGNSGNSCGSVETPLAMFEESFTVGAININDTIAGFSSRGPVEVDSSFRIKPNVCAPGVQVRSSWLNDSYRNANGTSMAGPHVAGVVALMISANPELAGQVELIENILEATARPKTTEQECDSLSGTEPLNNTFGYGNVDALAAVEMALQLISDIDEVVETDEMQFQLFPNPVNDVLYINSETYNTISALRVIASDGRVIETRYDLALPAEIEMQKYPQGLYFVQLNNSTPVLIQVSK